MVAPIARCVSQVDTRAVDCVYPGEDGGVDLTDDALEQQIEDADYNPTSLTYAAKRIVVGWGEEVDLAVEVLMALGWSNETEGA